MQSSPKRGVPFFHRILDGIEWAGNRLPHPITLFAILCAVVLVVSWFCAYFGISATGELIDSKTLELTEQTVTCVSLLSRDGIVYILTSMVKNFTDFAPLGIVLVIMLGVGCAEGSGYLSALLKKAVLITPRQVITPMLVFLGVMSNVATDVGYVLLIPIGAMLFIAYGRHPMAGLAAAFAGVSGGFSANLLVGALDPLLSGISTEAAHMIDPSYTVYATDNWYFMIASTLLIVVIGSLVTDHIVEPRLGGYNSHESDHLQTASLLPQEVKALKAANLTLLALVVFLVAAAIPKSSLLRNPETGSLIAGSPLIDGLIPLLALLFFLPSVVYGRVAGVYKGEKDICNQLQDNMSVMGSYIALVFVCAQFTSYFNYSRLGTILAIRGAELLKTSGISGPLLMVLFILFASLVNLLIGSASAKWTILAPVFIPMFMVLGYSPQLTQVAYRIGDSCTNLITPLMSYFAMIVVFARKYDPESGIGTLISTMLPYSLLFLAGWSVLLVAWMLLGLPLGPGAALLL